MKINRILIMIIPSSYIRIFLYKKCFKYNIDKGCKIGFTYIDAKFLKMEQGSNIGNFNYFRKCTNVILKSNSTIRKYNFFNNCKVLSLGKGSVISHSNKFQHNENVSLGVGGEITLGNMTNIVSNHYFDLTDNIDIGDDCIIAGKGSEFWTHGFDIDRNRIQGNIVLLNNIYVGAGTKFNYGLIVKSNNIIGMGSIVTKSIINEGYLIAGNPAKIIKKISCNYKDYGYVGKIMDTLVYRKIQNRKGENV